MRSSLLLLVTGLVAAVAASAPADTFVETFDGTNEGTWVWGANESFPVSGGNPGAYFRTDDLDTFAPQPRTSAAESEFTGDFRDRGVTSVGIDLKTFHVDFSADGRNLTLMLMHDNGTPGDPFDDTAAYLEHGTNVPLPGQDWISYDFDVPADETSLPAGWVLLNMGDSGAPPNHTWDEIIQDVTQVRYFYGNPEFFFIFQQWDLGMDNPRITTTGGVPGDTNGDGLVNVLDLLEVLQQWGVCGGKGCTADLNGDDVVNVADLLLVLQNWT